MLALIEIPHQRRARIHWYEEPDELICEVSGRAFGAGLPEPIDLMNAVYWLAADWSSFLLVQTAPDVDDVIQYVKSNRHQAHIVATFVPELEDAFCLIGGK